VPTLFPFVLASLALASLALASLALASLALSSARRYMLDYNRTGPGPPPLSSVARVTLLSPPGSPAAPESLALLDSLGCAVASLTASPAPLQSHVSYLLPLLLSSPPPPAPPVSYTLSRKSPSSPAVTATFTFSPPLPAPFVASLTLHPVSSSGSYYPLACATLDSGELAVESSFESPKPDFTAEKIRKVLEKRVKDPTPQGVEECVVS
jgi:hypothetical protein